MEGVVWGSHVLDVVRGHGFNSESPDPFLLTIPHYYAVGHLFNTSLIPNHNGIIFAQLVNDINIQMINTSEIKISVVIAEKYTELACRALHDAFGLAEPSPTEEL